MKTHNLKTWPEVFDATLEGRKTADFRRDDRDFEVGDFLLLQEWNPKAKAYTSASILVRITHIMRAPEFGMPEGYCLLSYRPVPPGAIRMLTKFIQAGGRFAYGGAGSDYTRYLIRENLMAIQPATPEDRETKKRTSPRWDGRYVIQATQDGYLFLDLLAAITSDRTISAPQPVGEKL